MYTKLTSQIILIFYMFLAVNMLNAQNIIHGIISTELSQPLENIVVSINGDANGSVLTDEFGYYEFSVPNEGDYLVRPCYNANILNGVNTLDKIIVSYHVNNQIVLNTPYKIIAADVNQNNEVEGGDTLRIHQAILGTSTFPYDKSWRFVDESFIFPDLSDPFASPFPEEIMVNNLQNNLELNFIGIKLGDVDYSASYDQSISTEDFNQGCFPNPVSNTNIHNSGEVKVFPNPFDREITIDTGKDYNHIDIEVYSSTGLLIKDAKFQNTDVVKLNLTNQLSGIYFVRIKMSDITKWITVVKS